MGEGKNPSNWYSLGKKVIEKALMRRFTSFISPFLIQNGTMCNCSLHLHLLCANALTQTWTDQ